MLHVRNADFGPNKEPVRHTTLFAGSTKRRHFTAEEKARIVAESFESGESVCSVARQHGLMAAQLFAWRKNARLRSKCPTLGDSPARTLGGLEIQAAETIEATAATAIAPIEIAIGAMIVRVPQGFDVATLRAVLKALAPIA
jgi:transposase